MCNWLYNKFYIFWNWLCKKKKLWEDSEKMRTSERITSREFHGWHIPIILFVTNFKIWNCTYFIAITSSKNVFVFWQNLKPYVKQCISSTIKLPMIGIRLATMYKSQRNVGNKRLKQYDEENAKYVVSWIIHPLLFQSIILVW